MGSKAKEEAIKDLVCMTRPDILMIQETKMEEADAIQSRKFFWNKSKGKAVRVRGASGGLATLWNPSVLELLEEDPTTHWLYTNLQYKDSGLSVSLFNIYAPVLISEKKDCWDSIKRALD